MSVLVSEDAGHQNALQVGLLSHLEGRPHLVHMDHRIRLERASAR